MTSGFTQGDDFVAARVSIDVPTEGIQSLREMSQGIDRFRTSVEAAARSSSTFVGYVNQMVQAGNLATEAHRNLAAQLERTTDLQQRSMGGGGAQSALPLSRSAPQGYVDPWAGMGVGTGSGRQPSPNTADYQQQIDQTRPDSRHYINAQAGRHRVLPGDLNPSEMAPVDLDAAAGRIEARDKHQRDQEDSSSRSGTGAGRSGSLAGRIGGGLARNMMSEMAVGGGSHMGMLGALQRGLGGGGSRPSAAAPGGSAGTAVAQAANAGDAASAEEAASSGGLGGMLKGLGRGGGALGVGLAGLGLLEKGGGIYQGYKNLGSIRGGGAAEGAGSEMMMRGMALNPFLSTEQSRQIIMAGLTEGYSGKQFDTVTQFMASNLKDMNIQVSESVNMLRKNVNEGGQSIGGLASSLGILKEMSKTGGMSLPDLAKAFEQGTGNMISSGASGGYASQQMLSALGGWAGDQTLKGRFAGMLQSGGSDAASGAMLEMYSGQGVPGLSPDMLPAYLSANGGNQGGMTSAAAKNLINRLMGKLQKNDPRYFNQLKILVMMLNRMFPGQNITPQIAMHMIDQYRGGHDPMQEGEEKQEKIASEVNAGAGPMSFAEGLGAAGTSVLDMGKMFAAGVTGNDQAAINAADDMGKAWTNASYNANAEASNPILNSIVGQYGATGVEVVDSSGKASELTGNRSQVQGLASGNLKWRRKGEDSGGYTLRQTPESGKSPGPDGGGNGGQTNVNFSPAQVQITFGAGGMTASPNPVQLTPNQQAVNAGVGSNTMNNPAPGDGYGYYTGRVAGQH